MTAGRPLRAFPWRWMALALIGIQGLAQADMRCGTALVAQGDSIYQVQRKCGPPAHREVMPAAPNPNQRGHNHAATLEYWVYGPRNGATYRLKFIDGQLVKIDLSR